MRTSSIALRIAIFLAAIVAWCTAWVMARAEAGPPKGKGALMGPLLPKSAGKTACFAGTFTGQVIDVEDWSRTRTEPSGTYMPDGRPYTRPVPATTKDVPVRSFTLELTYDTRKSDYDWIYNFRLLAEADGIGTMYASGECPWYARDKVFGSDKRKITGSTSSLFCYIDCDGGGFDLERAPDAPAVVMSFDPRIGLRMKGGCGGGGIYRINPASAGVRFRLQATSAEACRPVREWAARQ